MAGELQSIEGHIVADSVPYYIPQHTGLLNRTVAEVLNVKDKLSAFDSIMAGSVSQSDYDILADDWSIETRCHEAFARWRMSHVPFDMSVDDLSGGEKTKLFLAGLSIHNPEIILLDEPSNHLDAASRQLLYDEIRLSTSTIVIVSHDITLLDQLQFTCELSEHGIRSYGGNYSFYYEQKNLEDAALSNDIHTEEKAIRLARVKAQEVRQRQEKRLVKGAQKKSEVPRIFKKTLTNSSENTAAGLKERHDEIIATHQSKLSELRQRQRTLKDLKIDFDNASIRSGKMLVEARQINFGYQHSSPLWRQPFDFDLYSHDRVHISGDNGVGKTTFIRLILGTLTPLSGTIRRADFNWIYLDQNYTQVDVDCTIEELATRYNPSMETHDIRLRLNRFLFPLDTWDKSCCTLSGGEKMRLYLCCLMISNHTPDLIILDEPTNNLDISGVQILTQTISNYRGSLLVISHDRYFVDAVGLTKTIILMN
jgi:ATPase subunit of ABC transporter with duplicated ATPase domains